MISGEIRIHGVEIGVRRVKKTNENHTTPKVYGDYLHLFIYDR
jgi:hypothetical protein